jgi:hypothetical protein
VIDEDDGVPDAHPDEDRAAEDLAQLGYEPVVEGQRGQLVRARGEDERSRPEVEPVLFLDEIAAGEKPVGQLLDGALRRVQGGCQLGQGHAARAQGHDLEDPGHSVDSAMRAGRHAAEASTFLRLMMRGLSELMTHAIVRKSG